MKIVDKFLWFLVYIAVPLTLAYALIMSFVIEDWIAFIISLIGTFVIMFQIGYGTGKTR